MRCASDSGIELMMPVRLMLFVLLVGVLSGCHSNLPLEERPWLLGSGYNSRFHEPEDNKFSSYVEETRQMLRTAKYFPPGISAATRNDYLKRVAPFEMAPSAACREQGKQPSRGILLVHGLFDTPFIMRDLARVFSEQCFTVRTVLLPGHGTRPADLLHINHAEWEKAVNFGLETLMADMKEVYVAGFSLGGLLSLQAAARDPRIAAVLVFAPALAPRYKAAYWSRQASNFADYYKVFAERDLVKYESLPHRAGDETYSLGLDVERLLARDWHTPVYVAVSLEDDTIDARHTFDLMFGAIPRRLLRFELFAANKPNEERWLNRYYRERCQREENCHFHNSYLIEQGVLSLSHVGLVVAPDNDHYGRNGVYRNCLYVLSQRLLCEKETITRESCSQNRLCYGESIWDPRSPAIRRLTFNPLFSELEASVIAFIEATGKR